MTAQASRILATVALVGSVLLSVPAHAQASQAAAPPAEDTYRQLELFARVLSYVENNYVEPVEKQQLVYGAIKGMLETLDPHTQFMPPETFKEMKIDTSGEFGGLGIEIAKKDDIITVVSPIDDTPAARAGVRPGDQIFKIDDEPTQGMDLGRAIQKMRGPAGKKVMLTIMREGFSAPREIAIIRDHIRIVSVEGALHGGIAHVKVKNFQERTDTYLRRELDRLRTQNGGKELRGLVLDLRNNPGGLLDQAVALSDRFLPGNLTIVTTKGRNGRSVTEEKSKERDTERGYPMVVLVNAGSASASEIVAGALQDHGRATIIGTPTFGKGSVQTVIELEDGSGLKLTIARYYTPKGRSIQERGIAPDYVVMEGAPANAATTTREAPLRERDLRRHFKNEAGEAERKAELTPSLPPNFREWDVASKLTDIPLRVALSHLHGLTQGSTVAQKRATADVH